MGKFVITSKDNGEFQFVLKSTNGRTILISEVYKTKGSCNKGIDQIRVFAHPTAKFNLYTSADGLYFFEVQNEKGNAIGVSEGYNSLSSRSKGMTSLRNNASTAIVVDLSLTNKNKVKK